MVPFIVISGASGSGKTSLCRMIEKLLGFFYSVSHTTRPARPGEINTLDYHFVDTPVFKKMIEKKEFLEWANVYGFFYGTSKLLVEDHLKKGQGVVADLDHQGALAIKKIRPLTTIIFIKAPSLPELEKRLRERKTDSEDTIKFRLEKAVEEEKFEAYYDHVLTNNNLDETYALLEKMIKKL